MLLYKLFVEFLGTFVTVRVSYAVPILHREAKVPNGLKSYAKDQYIYPRYHLNCQCQLEPRS